MQLKDFNLKNKIMISLLTDIITYRGVCISLLAAIVLFCIGCSGEDSSSQAKSDSREAASMLRQNAMNGNLTKVKEAMNNKVEVNVRDQAGRTALMLAAYNGHKEVVAFLLENGAEIDATDHNGRTALLFAASGSFPETAELLLEWEANANTKDSGEGWTPLMFAAAGGHSAVVKTLLEHGADPSIEDKDGEKAIDFAKKNGFQDIAKLLMNAKKN